MISAVDALMAHDGPRIVYCSNHAWSRLTIWFEAERAGPELQGVSHLPLCRVCLHAPGVTRTPTPHKQDKALNLAGRLPDPSNNLSIRLYFKNSANQAGDRRTYHDRATITLDYTG